MELTGDHVLQQRLVGVAPLELCLPAVMMRVHKPRADDLIGAVDDLHSNACADICSNLRNLPVLDQDILFGGDHMTIRVVDQNNTVLE